MTARAYEQSGPGHCGHGDRYDLGRLWHAMSGAHRGAHRGRGRHRERGFGWWGSGFPFGAFPPGGGPFGPGRKARRGDIRTAALLLLAEEPRNGYQIMQEVEERSEGVWRPSPGSVYPALAQLEDEGLIRSEQIDGRRLFVITEQGRALLGEPRRAWLRPLLTCPAQAPHKIIAVFHRTPARSGTARRRRWSWKACTSASTRWRRCAESISWSAPGRRSASSGRTGPASRRLSTCCARSCGRARGRRRWRGTTSCANATRCAATSDWSRSEER